MNEMHTNGEKKNLIAHRHYSGFPLAHDTYNALSVASDGCIYYVLSSEDFRIGGHVYRYDPHIGDSTLIGDLTVLCGEETSNAIGQGKSQGEFFEMGGKLSSLSPAGVYERIAGMERMYANPPEGLGLYRGGHILADDRRTGQTEELALAPHGEGMVSMTMDTDRGE